MITVCKGELPVSEAVSSFGRLEESQVGFTFEQSPQERA